MKTRPFYAKKTRDNLLANGQNESVADHMHKLGLLLMNVFPYLRKPIDELRALKMTQIHDLGEAKIGDISLSVLANNPEARARKKQMEAQAVKEYAGTLPKTSAEQIMSLYAEYEAGETRESKIVHALDRLDATLQSNLHLGGVDYWGDCPNGEFYYNNSLKEKPYIAELDEPILTALEQYNIARSAYNIRKCNIPLNKEGQALLSAALLEHRLVR